MNLFWLPFWVLGAVALFVNISLYYVGNSRPLDDDLAYEALERKLSSSELVAPQSLKLSPATVMHRNGEAIFFGEGSAENPNVGRQGVPIVENVKFKYMMVISRQCNEMDSKCYEAEAMQLTGEK